MAFGSLLVRAKKRRRETRENDGLFSSRETSASGKYVQLEIDPGSVPVHKAVFSFLFTRQVPPVTDSALSRLFALSTSSTTTLDRTGTTLPSCGHKARHRNWWKCHSKRQALPPSRTTYHVGSAQGQLSVRDGTNEFSNPLLSTLLLSPVDTRDGGSSTPHRRPVRRGDGRCGRRSFRQNRPAERDRCVPGGGSNRGRVLQHCRGCRLWCRGNPRDARLGRLGNHKHGGLV